MKPTVGILVFAIAAAGCAPVERSRQLGNPEVPALAIAQQVCAACHGAQGRSGSPNFPHLATQPAPYLEIQLKAFRNHHRSDPAGVESMWGLSQHLSDDQINGLAAYYAGQKPAVPVPLPAGVNREAARSIVEHGLPDKGVPACVSCHGAGAQGDGQFPRLAGQHADYLVKQLLVFQGSDQRPDGQIMQAVAHGLPPDDFRSVASYLESLPIPTGRP